MMTDGVVTTFQINTKAGIISIASDTGSEKIHKEKMRRTKFYSLSTRAKWPEWMSGSTLGERLGL